MRLLVDTCVCNPDNVINNAEISIKSKFLKRNKQIDCRDSIAYPPFINSHDHLISNWYPKAGFGKTYPNVSIWVEDMKNTDAFKERNKVWINDGSFDLTQEAAFQIVQLGIYKNLFSGCAVVQDHVPNQKPEYYENNPIRVLKEYSQYHSLSMGNWWGGESADKEYARTNGEDPFILHLGEGIDDEAKECFISLKQNNLLRSNTLLIHGIALTKEQIKECAEAGTSICWCPNSNYYLVGETLKIDAALECGANVVLGTDSTMSGSINLLEEIQFAHQKFPHIPMPEIYKMISTNAVKALNLSSDFGELEQNTSNLLLLKKYNDDPFDNLIDVQMDDIQLMIYQGIPVYGDTSFLEEFEVYQDNYFHFGNDRFVIGHPEKILDFFSLKLGYKKEFPFLPF